MSQSSSLVASAIIAGILSGAAALAQDTKSGKPEGAATADTTTTPVVKKKMDHKIQDKNSCGGKNGCGAGMKMDKKEEMKKETATETHKATPDSSPMTK